MSELKSELRAALQKNPDKELFRMTCGEYLELAQPLNCTCDEKDEVRLAIGKSVEFMTRNDVARKECNVHRRQVELMVGEAKTPAPAPKPAPQEK